MSELVYAPSLNGSGTGGGDDLKVWKERRRQAAADRQQYEPVWRLCSHFAANKQWVGWGTDSATGTRGIVDLTTRKTEKGREHFTANVITQYVWTILGKLFADDFRPDLSFRREDIESEAYARQAQQAMEFAWDEEINAEEVIFEILLGACKYGTAGQWCRFDPTQGKYLTQVPVRDGRPILGPEEAHQHVADLAAQGRVAQFRNVHEGRITWEPLLPDNILPPPGVRREKDFPWLIIERPVPVDLLKTVYPNAEIKAQDELTPVGNAISDSRKLRAHALLATGFEMPTAKYPKGRTVIWSGDKQLGGASQLPYLVGGVPKMGVFFYHYHRLADRFWSQGVVEPLIGPQRQRNRARSQLIEMKDRNLGRVYAEEGTFTVKNRPVGKIMEIVEIKPGRRMPQETEGVPPGSWLSDEVEMNDLDMDRISGLREVSMGAAPQGVAAYSAMALLKEEDDRRVGPVLKLVRERVAEAVSVTLEAMKTYWPEQKQILLSGDNHIVDAFFFNAAKLPANVYVKVGQGAPRPRSQAAEIQMCFDLYDRSIQGGQPLPLSWLKDSLQAGRPLPLPKTEMDVQKGKAEMENYLLVRGQQVQPAPYDAHQLHIQVHTAALASFQLLPFPAAQQAVQMLQQHIQAHQMAMQLQAGQAAAAMGGGPPGVPQLQGPQGQLSQAPPSGPAPISPGANIAPPGVPAGGPH